MSETCDVLVVGGGPTGLFLGLRLAQLGLDVRVLERSCTRPPHSRSIGIHPPSLERLGALGLIDAFLARGVTVRRGHAFANKEFLGTLEFASLPGPYPFVLTLPQSVTESVLSAELCRAYPAVLSRGAEVVRVTPGEREVRVQVRCEGEVQEVRAAFVVGCDGKKSAVRGLLGVPFVGGAYTDTYLMGDFEDNTPFGADAAIYLTDGGIIESFPLPGGVRRWVVKTEDYAREATAADMSARVGARLGHPLPVETNTMLSAFGVQHFLARRFTEGRVALAGDAAHVLSPIGGQGMNLGWLDAWTLGETFALVFSEGKRYEPLFALYNQRRLRAARAAIRRAEFNMMMGRKTALSRLRNGAVKVALRRPLEPLLARLFTMQGLER